MLLFSALMALSMLDAQQGTDPVEPWRHVHGWLVEQRDGMVRDLEIAHERLLQRARAAGDEAAMAKLTDRPPEIHPVGYGVLPEIVSDPPPSAGKPAENRYSLEEMSTSCVADLRDAALLARRAASDEALPLDPWIAEFRRLQQRLRNLEENLNYHARWQQELRGYRRWFERRNRLVDRVRAWQAQDQSDDPARREQLERELHEQLAPFRPTPGLRVERDADGRALLRLPVSTDIEDADYLERVRQSVIAPFERAAEREQIDLRLELTWLPTTPEKLYAPGPPPRAIAIDREEHLARFPDDALVLTTGVERTVAVTGRAVVLGSGEITPRVLAHEFGHLLGFDDAYLRGFEGEPDGAYGAVFVEWVGLFDDLMGNPAGGEVSREMLERLISVYGSPD